MLQLCRQTTHLYVVELVVRIHHAVEYEMKTAAAPEKAMANNKNPRDSAGLKDGKVRLGLRRLRNRAYKFKFRFSDPQSSKRTEATIKIGMHSKLL